MLKVITEWEFNEIDKTPKEEGVFYVLQNQDKSKYHHSQNGGVDTIAEASKYSTVSSLKQAIKRVYYTPNRMLLHLNNLTGLWEKVDVPVDAFDGCTILKVKEVC